MPDKLRKFIHCLDVLRPGASMGQIAKGQTDLGVTFPEDYVQFMLRSDGGEGWLGPNYIMLYDLEDVIYTNRLYAEFSVEFLVFGSNGGGEFFAFDTQADPMPVVTINMVSFSREDAIFCGRTFTEFLEFLYQGGNIIEGLPRSADE
jgi:hypothetical protein